MSLSDRPMISVEEPNGGSVPAGSLPWITAELIADTIATWQPYYRDPLTRQEAVEILLSVGRLIDVLN